MTDTPLSIHWFQQDLRLADNPALTAAAEAGRILPIYILDDDNAGKWQIGAASRWWLHHSLAALNKSLNGKLSLYVGKAEEIIPELVKTHQVDAVYWNRCYEPWRTERDSHIKTALKDKGIKAESYNGSLLWAPWDVLKADKTPYKVFTPYYRKGCLNAAPPRPPLDEPEEMQLVHDSASTSLGSLSLLPTKPRWDKKMEAYWEIGEAGAQDCLEQFIAHGLNGYKKGRDFPSRTNTSHLSPYLHFGEISPNTVWYAAKEASESDDLYHFLSELGWREFSYYLLFHFPSLPEENFQPKFNGFPWVQDDKTLLAWQQGKTGIPLVDAGMRELWETGYMHNRVRMIVASFLVKNLLIHWHEGEAWFWDCLVDADLASNSASWQWVAGSGADAAPYFRIFNPVTQARKFDPHGTYIRRYVPELKDLPDKYLHAPWEADSSILQTAGITLGETYPHPLADLRSSRIAALAAYSGIRNTAP